MNKAALRTATRQFDKASKHAGEASHAINLTAAGLASLTEVIADLVAEVEKLRSEVMALRERD